VLNSIESVLLATLPLSFAAKTLALGFMWWHLAFRTVPTGPLGRRINISFRDTTIMSSILTCLMVALWRLIDPADIHWPVTSALLFALAIWPWRAAWTHASVYLTYRQIAHEKASRTPGPGGTV